MVELINTKGINWSKSELESLRYLFSQITRFLAIPHTPTNRMQLYEYYLHFFSHFPVLLLEVTEKNIIRARRNFSGEIFKEKADISYNSKSIDKIQQGRFNKPKESIFYGAVPIISPQASFLPTSIFEACKEISDDFNNEDKFIFTLGLWEVTPFLVLNFCFDEKHLSGNERMNSNIRTYIESFTKTCNPDSAEFIVNVISVFSKIISLKSTDIRTYIVSSTIFDAIKTIYLKDGREILGIIYPSAATESSGLNIAVVPYAVDKYLQLTHVTMYQVDRIATNHFELEIYPISEDIEVHMGKFNFSALGDKRIR